MLRGDKAQVDSLVQLLATVASEETNKAAGDGGMAQPPKWAQSMADIRNMHAADPTQSLVPVAINNRIGLAIVDTGAYKTIMDKEMAKAFGLKVRAAVAGDCGKFGVPGSGVVHDYVGCIEQPFELRLSEHVRFTVGGMRIISHPFPMMLLGADILKGGRKPPGWNYVGWELEDGLTKVGGSLLFRRGGVLEKVMLHQVPTAEEGREAMVGQLATVAGPPFGGQYL